MYEAPNSPTVFNISVSLTLTNEHEVMGVNNMYQLSIAEEQFQTKLRKKFMEKGVILQNPETIYFSYDTKVESNVKIGPNNVFGKSVIIKNNVSVSASNDIENTVINNFLSNQKINLS